MAAGPPDFAAARRNSRRVRLLRFGLPVLALAGAAVYAASSGLGRLADLPIDYDSMVVNADAIVIERPRLSGYQAGGEAYQLTAERATQHQGNADQLMLETVTATVQLPGGRNAQFAAPAGEYDTRAGVMVLRGGLTMTLDDGLEARFEELAVDVANGTIRSATPFTLGTASLEVTGNALEMTRDEVLVTGGVRTVFGMGVPAAAAIGN